MMEFRDGQILVILSPFTDSEAYGYINSITEDSLSLSVNPAGFLRNGWDILCIFLDNNDIYEFYSEITYLEGNTIVIKRPIENQLNTIEKRRFARVDCEIGFVARPVTINNVSVEKLGKTFLGTIKNISAGGVLAETNLCLPVDSVFRFKLKTNYFIDCTAKVLRVNELPSEKKFQMGCKFVNMRIEDFKAISMFTFKEQLKKKRKQFYEIAAKQKIHINC
ncbi:MAG TPA: PilZ domain-containing protein [Bacillota bacterium]|nr:PilZ domain-containing protein [Bacillota bacterium]